MGSRVGIINQDSMKLLMLSLCLFLSASSLPSPTKLENPSEAPSGYLPPPPDYEDGGLEGYSRDSEVDELNGYEGDDLEGRSGISDTNEDNSPEENGSVDDSEADDEDGSETDDDSEKENEIDSSSDASGDGTAEDENENPADEDSDATAKDTSEAGSDVVNPDVKLCPGKEVEGDDCQVCVSVCPGTTARIYGACVQGCAERCPDGEQPR